MEIHGWLFDLYPLQSSMILWIKDEDGLLRRLEDPFRPRFYTQGKKRDLLLEYSLMLKDGQTKKEDLVIGKTISQEPNAYKVDSLTALAAQQLEDVGIPIHPGEKVRYVIKDALSKDRAERVRPFPLVGPDDTYDVKKYLEMLAKATEEILIHFGYDVKRLTEMVDSSLL